MKKFDIKIYDRLKEYKLTINPNKIMNAVSFSSNLDGWQWELNLNLTTEVNIDCGDIIEVYCYDDFNKDGMLLYCGFVSEVNNIYSSSKTYNNVKCLWIGSLLWTSYYTTTWTVTKTIEGHITDLVTDYNTIYWTTIFSVWTIEDESTVALDFSEEWTFLEKLNVITKSGENYFYINQNGEINILKRPQEATHLLTYKKNVEELKLSYNIESIVNQYRVTAYCGGDGWTYTNVYSDNNSISQYGVKSAYKYTKDYYYRTWVDNRANSLLQENSTPKNNTQVIVNSVYNILSITPWQSIAVMNIDRNIDNLQIKKITFTSEKLTLILEETEKFSDYLQFNKDRND